MDQERCQLVIITLQTTSGSTLLAISLVSNCPTLITSAHGETSNLSRRDILEPGVGIVDREAVSAQRLHLWNILRV